MIPPIPKSRSTTMRSNQHQKITIATILLLTVFWVHRPIHLIRKTFVGVPTLPRRFLLLERPLHPQKPSPRNHQESRVEVNPQECQPIPRPSRIHTTLLLVIGHSFTPTATPSHPDDNESTLILPGTRVPQILVGIVDGYRTNFRV